MNTAKLKAYAPQARKDFIKAVTERANYYGIFSDDHIEPIEFKGDVAIVGERAFTKKEGELREKLVNRIKRDKFELVMRACAYTWFNRFVALRYMELHDYLEHGYRVLSNNGGSDIPEILDHAADVDLQGLDKDKVVELRLAGNKDNELYRLLIVAQCNALYKAMPFLFEKIDSETELLLPDNLLLSNSPIHKMVNAIDEEDWNDVEIIGWIYQFYISERKDEVIGKVVKSEDIPAATQLFTPNWIVKYMVQNTLGRMWLATYPDSPLKDKMEFYIKPAEQELEVQEQLDSVTPKELNPEEITFFDPACGSGHILVEAYDILKEIYLERGYRTKDIPRLIIEKNLYGLDIDDRAAQLACFAILMIARRDEKTILSKKRVNMNIMAIQGRDEIDPEVIARTLLKKEVVRIGKGDQLFPEFKGQLQLRTVIKPEIEKEVIFELLNSFNYGKTIGSLIRIRDKIAENLLLMNPFIDSVKQKGDLFEVAALDKLLPLKNLAKILANTYDCIVTNPPYMGSRYFNNTLKTYINRNYKIGKGDLYASFILKILGQLKKNGYLGMITIPNWMFLSTFEQLRREILDRSNIESFVHIGRGVWGADFGSCAFVIRKKFVEDFKGVYLRLFEKQGSITSNEYLEQRFFEANPYYAKSKDFIKIPKSPIAYWVSDSVKRIYDNFIALEDVAYSIQGMITGNNNKFLRQWFEPSFHSLALYHDEINNLDLNKEYWIPYNKGGDLRKWYGNNQYVVNWKNNGTDLVRSRTKNRQFYLKPGVTWTFISSSFFAARSFPAGFLWDVAGSSAFEKKNGYNELILGLMCSKVGKYLLDISNPTLNYQVENILALPISQKLKNHTKEIRENVLELIKISKKDWDSYETSWDFQVFPWLLDEFKTQYIGDTFHKWEQYCSEKVRYAKSFEEENNRTFIKVYGLENDITPEVVEEQITLARADRETDTKRLISYAVGCMMGRYSLDYPGLIYANTGNNGFDPSKYSTFPADDDGIVPIMDQEWFPDDATIRFVKFLEVVWPPETLDDNLKFISNSLSPKNNETSISTIRRYISNNFFKDHRKNYKKYPIYWLFSSGKNKAFECLVYLHRYNESTLSRMRSTYVTPLQGNMSARLEFLQNEKDAAATASAQRKIQKEIETLKKKQTELSAFDDELRHYADMKISLDLDDGVKVNYGKFGNLLAEKKAITGKK